MNSTVTVTCEQAVYGSFPFRDQGYEILTASPGCRQEWLTTFARYCRDLGQPPSDVSPRIDRLLFARKVPSGPWVVALGSAQGCDDRGRPGAWAFHGLFLSGRDFRKLGLSPFPLIPFLLDKFDAGMGLTRECLSPILPSEDPPVFTNSSMIRWVSRGNRLRRVSDADTFASTDAFWNSLGPRAKRKRSMTTWAFRSDTPFHWACVGSRPLPDGPAGFHRTLWHFETGEEIVQPHRKMTLSHRFWGLSFAGFAVAALSLTIFRSCFRHDAPTVEEMNDSLVSQTTETRPPVPSKFRSTDVPAGLREFVAEKLTDWAERLDFDAAAERFGTSAQAERIVQAIRYAGPLLPPDFGSRVDGTAPGRIALEYAAVVRRHSETRTWVAGDHASSHMNDPRIVLAKMAWCIRDDDLAKAAYAIENAPAATAWLERFRDRVIPDSIPDDLPATGFENRFPELAEYRLHLSRLIRLRE